MATNAEKYFTKGNVISPGSIVLIDPKYPHNVGMILRMAACHCISEVWCIGPRIWKAVDELDRVPREERLKNYKDVKLMWSVDLPKFHKDCVPVAMEFLNTAENIVQFEHPKGATYIFGPEDGTLGGSILKVCHRFIKVDTIECLNLATAAATLLYDIQVKQYWGDRIRVSAEDMCS